MKSYLQHLENNEAILLMYLADELPPQDRAEVEGMLSSEARLRGELENLRQTQQLAFDALESLDASTRAPVSPLTAQNRVMALMREWVDTARPALAETAGTRQFPWWRTTFATAATMLICYYIWAVYHAPLPPIVKNPPPRDLTNPEKLAILYNSFQDSSSEESRLHVAEVATVMQSGTAEDPVDVGTASDSNAASNATGEP